MCIDPIICHILSFKTVVGYIGKFNIIKDERLVSKIECKTSFEAPTGCHGTGIVESLDIIVAGCNLKQFDGLT